MILTEADRKFLQLGLRNNRGLHIALNWYLRGFELLPYQYAWHHINVMNTSFVAGIATGKTTIVGASNLYDCISIPYFRALNTSVTAKQAELPFEMIMAWVEGNDRLEHLVDHISLRPYPKITFKNFSEYEFRTCGIDARFIRGSEYDRINYDEAGLDNTGAAIKVLRGRLRGVRPITNVPRMARMDVTTSPTAALWLRERYERGEPGHLKAELDKYRSMRVATWDNTKLTREQVEAMKAEYPPDMIDVEMGGMFPDYGLSMFPLRHVAACTDQALYDAAYIALNPEDEKERPKRGWVLEEDLRHGVTKYEAPFRPGRIYVLGGDPGTGSLPKRDAACVIVADVTEKPYKVVYFHWVTGKGSYNPFLNSFKYAIDKYSPVLRGIDATGTQKGIDEVAFENIGIATDRVSYNRDKYAMLNMLISDITNHYWRWPTIKGLQTQLSTYTIENDKAGYAQDIVMTLATVAFMARFIPAGPLNNQAEARANFRNRRQRTNRPRRR